MEGQCSTPERGVRVRALARDIVLCSWARHLTLTISLSTLWVPVNSWGNLTNCGGVTCMEGHSGQKCNLIATCIPLDRTFIPLDRTFLPLDRTFIPLDRTFLPFDRTFIPLDRTFLPFDRTSIILSLVILHWFITVWHFTFMRTSVETAFHRIVTIVWP